MADIPHAAFALIVPQVQRQIKKLRPLIARAAHQQVTPVNDDLAQCPRFFRVSVEFAPARLTTRYPLSTVERFEHHATRFNIRIKSSGSRIDP